MTDSILQHVCVCKEGGEKIFKLNSQLNNRNIKKSTLFLLEQKIKKIDLLSEELISDEKIEQYCHSLIKLNKGAAEKFERRWNRSLDKFAKEESKGKVISEKKKLKAKSKISNDIKKSQQESYNKVADLFYDRLRTLIKQKQLDNEFEKADLSAFLSIAVYRENYQLYKNNFDKIFENLKREWEIQINSITEILVEINNTNQRIKLCKQQDNLKETEVLRTYNIYGQTTKHKIGWLIFFILAPTSIYYIRRYTKKLKEKKSSNLKEEIQEKFNLWKLNMSLSVVAYGVSFVLLKNAIDKWLRPNIYEWLKSNENTTASIVTGEY